MTSTPIQILSLTGLTLRRIQMQVTRNAGSVCISNKQLLNSVGYLRSTDHSAKKMRLAMALMFIAKAVHGKNKGNI